MRLVFFIEKTYATVENNENYDEMIDEDNEEKIIPEKPINGMK